MPQDNQIIIGITGTAGSGKDTVADYLIKKGFFYLSLSDLIREECEKKGGYQSRDDLIKTGNQLRKEYGSGILAKLARERVKDKNKVVIGSIRNMSEVEEFKKNTNFKLFKVDALIETRYQRIQQRGKIDDQVSLEKFKEQENFERQGNFFQQQLDQVAMAADDTIVNDETLDELYQKVDKILEKISK